MSTVDRYGPRLVPGQGATFRLWAPGARSVGLGLARFQAERTPVGRPASALPLRRAHSDAKPIAREDGRERPSVSTFADCALEVLPMLATADGWYELHVSEATAGTRYRFRIDDEIDVPDPASAFQPEDVLGPSEVIDHAYDWQATDWRGRPWHEAAILELHVGTFTPAGTFRAAIERLGDVAAAGFTAIELMPLADFSGRWNWGYDGVLLFAPDSSYGRPEDLKALIDAAHRHGLMVLLDVVYNHFGPEGNFLARYAPSVFTTAHQTPWGAAIDYGVAEVRDFAIANALHWLDRYRFDGLRLDAVHAIAEPGPLLAALSHAVGALAERTDRAIHLVLENDDNRASLLDPATDPPAGGCRAQWNDDYHHVWHALLTGESFGYYRDYSQQPGRHLARALSTGFVYQGEPSPNRNGRRRGEPSGALPPTAFVNFLQNHDQIGNRARGERLTVLTTPERLEAALAITLLAPMPPLMFMGEEWGATEPFPFFCDFTGDLAEAVRRGRRAEFTDAYAQAGPDDPIPDPLAEETFRSAVLDWNASRAGRQQRRLRLVRQLLTLRRRAVVPRLAGLDHAEAAARWDEGVLTAHWRLGGPTRLNLLANLGDMARPRPPLTRATRSLWGGSPPPQLPPWSVFWSIGDD